MLYCNDIVTVSKLKTRRKINVEIPKIFYGRGRNKVY